MWSQECRRMPSSCERVMQGQRRCIECIRRVRSPWKRKLQISAEMYNTEPISRLEILEMSRLGHGYYRWQFVYRSGPRRYYLFNLMPRSWRHSMTCEDIVCSLLDRRGNHWTDGFLFSKDRTSEDDCIRCPLTACHIYFCMAWSCRISTYQHLQQADYQAKILQK